MKERVVQNSQKNRLEKELGERYGIHADTVSAIRNNRSWGHLGGKRGPKSTKGVNHHNAKLTESQVSEILESSGTHKAIAAKYG